jgi:tetratricopeptide (TPR) repeat protein
MGAFTKARLAEQDEKWPDAQQWYQTAAELDPAWFEAQYNTGVLAHRLRNYSLALPRYELALALQPESVDARYNFALALKAAGYVVDAVDEFKKILAGSPDEVRAHLALANLCAQSLRDTTQARKHYLKVLDLQPDNPQASDIRFWLSANPK